MHIGIMISILNSLILYIIMNRHEAREEAAFYFT